MVSAQVLQMPIGLNGNHIAAMAPGVSVVVPSVRKRRMAPKARTGCLTCRQRHIKCDERKPICQRCKSLGVVCKGLGYGSSIFTEPPATSTSLQRCRTLVTLSPSERLPCNELGLRYFRLFQAYSAADLSGYFQSDFWSQLLFQQSHHDPSIKDAIIAIGALYKSIEIAQSPRISLNVETDHRRHLKSAFQYYQKAICSQREAIEVGCAPSRTSLISCLLFICFEALQGNQESVLQQTYCGVNLLHEYESSVSCQPSLGCHIDEELSQIFARLELQLRTIEDGRPQRYTPSRISQKLPYSSTQGLDIRTKKQDRPVMRSIQEARRSWDHLYPRVFHARQKAEPYRYHLQEDVPIDIIMGVKRQKDELISWRKIFDYLFQDTWNDISETNRLGASAIRISYHLAYVKISTSFELMETIYDSFVFDFREIIRLSKYLIQTKRPSLFQRIAFSLDSITGIPLFVTGMKCRDRLLRREASALLRYPERREGVWDSPMASVIINWMIAIEEAGLVPDQVVPESNRFRMLDLNCGLQDRKVWVRCGQRVPGAEDYVNIRELNSTY